MATINVYQQFFAAEGSFNDVQRHGASVMLIATSEEGQIRYEVAVTFFPHVTDDDYAVSYDAYFSKVVYEAKGRRSKKREQELMALLREETDALAQDAKATVFWDRPLTEAQRG